MWRKSNDNPNKSAKPKAGKEGPAGTEQMAEKVNSDEDHASDDEE